MFAAIQNVPGTMSVAWSRLDAEVEQLKRLSAQTCGNGGASSVPAALRTHSRRQSGANRRAIAGLQANLLSQASPAGSVPGSDVLSTQPTDAVIQYETLPQLSQHILAGVSQPCSTDEHLSTVAVNSPAVISDCVSTPIILASHITASDTAQQASNVTSMDTESDSVHVTWSNHSSVENVPHQLNESVHLIIPTSESTDISSVSAATTVTVAAVGTCQQVADTVSSNDAAVSADLYQPSTPTHHETEGCKNCLY